MHPARLPIETFAAQVRMEYSKGSGPGGQHRNRTKTGVRATHLPTGVQARAGERRSLDQNKQRALSRLRMQVAIEVRSPSPVRPDEAWVFEPSETWRSRVKAQRITVSPRHPDLPALLAEALDLIDWVDLDVPRAARLLDVTTAQLVRFLAVEPAALSFLNERRRKLGLPTYRSP